MILGCLEIGENLKLKKKSRLDLTSRLIIVISSSYMHGQTQGRQTILKQPSAYSACCC